MPCVGGKTWRGQCNDRVPAGRPGLSTNDLMAIKRRSAPTADGLVPQWTVGQLNQILTVSDTFGDTVERAMVAKDWKGIVAVRCRPALTVGTWLPVSYPMEQSIESHMIPKNQNVSSEGRGKQR